MCANSHSMAASGSALPVASNAFLHRISGKPIALSWAIAPSLKVGSDSTVHNRQPLKLFDLPTLRLLAAFSGSSCSPPCRPFPIYLSRVSSLLSGRMTGMSNKVNALLVRKYMDYLEREAYQAWSEPS